MNHRHISKMASYAAAAALFAILLCGLVSAAQQTETTAPLSPNLRRPLLKPPAKPATPKSQTPAKTRASQQRTSTGASNPLPGQGPSTTNGPAPGRSLLTGNNTGTTTTRAPLTSSGTNTQNNVRTNGNNGSSSRPALSVSGEGLGHFPTGPWDLTVYSCFRNGVNVICDFDVTNSRNAVINARELYPNFSMVNSGGRIIRRSDAYFVDTDGSEFPTSAVGSGNKVRFVMIFNNVPSTFTNVALAYGATVVQGIPIESQEAGTGGQTNAQGIEQAASTAKGISK